MIYYSVFMYLFKSETQLLVKWLRQPCAGRDQRSSPFTTVFPSPVQLQLNTLVTRHQERSYANLKFWWLILGDCP